VSGYARTERGEWLGRGRALALGAALWAALLLAVLVRWSAPAPAGHDAAPDSFSAARARRALERFVGDGAPRPLGSAAGLRARERLVAELEALGLAPEVQRARLCNDNALFPVCAEVGNVVAVVGGDATTLGADARCAPGAAGPVVLVAHHDSVGAGPGASDDGAGVAVLLETARALGAGPPTRHPVVLLFTDGEEAGLLGARAFAREHPLARVACAAVNVDARGSSGPSLLFQTSAGAGPLVALAARALERPVTSSLFGWVYDQLPNDTDFTVLRDRGLAGYNLAFIEELAHYHTSLDDLGHASDATLQHLGEHALALARALAGAPGPLVGDETVWFDVLAFGIVRWPRSAALPLAALAVALHAAAAWLLIRRRRSRTRGSMVTAALGAAALALLGPALAALLGYGARLATRIVRGESASEWYAPPPSSLAPWVAGALASMLALRLVGGRGGEAERLGAWWPLCLLGLVCARALPEASYLFVAPALLAGLTAVLARRERRAGVDVVAWLGLAPIGLAGVLWLSVAFGVQLAVGPMAHPVVAAAVALALGPALPLASRAPRTSRVVGVTASVAAGAFVVLGAVGALRSPFFPEQPQRVSIAHVERHGDGTAAAHWLVETRDGPVPEALRAAARLGPTTDLDVLFTPFGRGALGDAPAVGLRPPVLEAGAREPAREGRERIRLRVRSERAAPWLAVVVADDVVEMSLPVGGRLVPVPLGTLGEGSPLWSGRGFSTFWGFDPDGLDLVLEVARGRALRVELVDASSGLPAVAAPVARARAPLGVPSQQGDLSLVARVFEIP
jgi:hypothetical protein